MPGLTEVAESAGILSNAVEEAVAHYYPLLLVIGLSPEHDLADHWLHNQVLPVLRAKQRRRRLPATAEAPMVFLTDRTTTIDEFANALLTGLSPAS